MIFGREDYLITSREVVAADTRTVNLSRVELGPTVSKHKAERAENGTNLKISRMAQGLEN
jgi:hypothetical protein